MPAPKGFGIPMTPERFDEIAASAQRQRDAVSPETRPGFAAILANVGVPVAAARVLANTIHALQQRVDELERLAASSTALNALRERVAVLEKTQTPAHMRQTEKR